MAETSGYVRSTFSKTLLQREIQDGRVYIDESDATTFFGYPSDARRDVEVDLTFQDSQSGKFMMKIGLRRDGDKYYFNRGWSEFVRKKKLRDRDIITFYKFKRREGIPEAREFMVGVPENK
jgi:hypothetical protein